LTPYVAHLLESIKPVPVHALRGTTAPKPSPWVFPANSRTGHIAAPTAAHNRALQAAGLPPLSLHDLRRSYATLSEWTQAPAGVAAQIQGHRASALRERHYIRRPVDLLRVW